VVITGNALGVAKASICRDQAFFGLENPFSGMPTLFQILAKNQPESLKY